MLERSHSLPLEAMSGHQPRDDSPATRMPLAVPLSHSTPDLSPLGEGVAKACTDALVWALYMKP